MNDFFKFEDGNTDFPFYNGNPKLSIFEWFILLLGVLIFTGLVAFPFELNNKVAALIFCLSTLIPILYVSRGQWNLFFRRPKNKDILLIIKCLTLYYIYSFSMVFLLRNIGIEVNSNAILNNIDFISFLFIIAQLIGEELFKIILLLIVMFLVYHFTNKRKISIICGVIISLLLFGLIHYNAYNGALSQIIFIIGFGSIFYLYAYLKTKNVIISYIAHVLIDSILIMITIPLVQI